MVDDQSEIHRLALHATELKFRHPSTNELLEFQTPWPIDMLRFIERLPPSDSDG